MEATLQELTEANKKLRMALTQQGTEKDLEMLQKLEQLKRDNLFQLKQMKAKLLAQNDEQLQTTTKLTILQNMQLTTELDYQSRQTEDLIMKNQKMKEQIDSLKRDIAIHKDVEKELAKRSQFSQQVIKRLRQENKKLELGNQTAFSTDMAVAFGNTRNARGNKTQTVRTTKNEFNGDAEDLVGFLENKLDNHEKNLQTKQHEYEQLLQDHFDLQEKFSLTCQKYKRAAYLLSEFLEETLNGSPQLLMKESEINLDLEKVQQTEFTKLDKEDKISLLLVLLKQLQPFISAHTLTVAPPQGQNARSNKSIDNSGKKAQAMPLSTRNARKQMFGQSESEDGLGAMLANVNV